MKFLFCLQDDEAFWKSSSGTGIADSQSNEIQRFELLRNELIELEQRVQKSADQSENEEVELSLSLSLKNEEVPLNQRNLICLLLTYSNVVSPWINSMSLRKMRFLLYELNFNIFWGKIIFTSY